MDETLKPCPFCGGTNIIAQLWDDTDDLIFGIVECRCGGCFMSEDISYFATDDEKRKAVAEAIAGWNVRA
jgi:Lar family restriction alleviation protein